MLLVVLSLLCEEGNAEGCWGEQRPLLLGTERTFGKVYIPTVRRTIIKYNGKASSAKKELPSAFLLHVL